MLDPHAAGLFSALLTLVPVIGLIFIILFVIPFWMIWKKAGFSPWLSILMVVPLVSIVMLYVLAFADWKVVPTDQAAALPPRV